MQRRFLSTLPGLLAIALASRTAALAQTPASSTGSQGGTGHFGVDTLGRYEWTQDVPAGTPGTPEESRWRLQLRPRYEISVGVLDLGVGADLNYSKDENDRPPAGETTLPIVRDNYRSRDVRLDLAYGRLRLGPITVEGGRFRMPIPLTEMIWDQDLRPQGGAASLRLGDPLASVRLSLTGLYAKGSHVYEDDSSMYGGGAELSLGGAAAKSRLQLVGSYLQFQDLERLQQALQRQNTTLGGRFVYDYRVVDGVARLSVAGPLTLVADYCWNTALDSDNRGLWLAAMLGALDSTRARVEYTYARIDKDATVAAFNSDDLFWGTGWEGHRVDVGTGTARGSSLHAIAQWQRPRNASAPDGGWVKRWRLEWRTSF